MKIKFQLSIVDLLCLVLEMAVRITALERQELKDSRRSQKPYRNQRTQVQCNHRSI